MDASYRKVSQAFGKDALKEEEVKDLLESLQRDFESASRERECRGGEPTPLQREHIEQRTAFKARLAEEAAKTNRTLQQKREQMKYLVHVKVGGEMDAETMPFFPSAVELDAARQEWQDALGDDYLVIATHYLTEIEMWLL